MNQTQLAKISFKKRMNKINQKKRPNSSCFIRSTNYSINSTYGGMERSRKKSMNNINLTQLNYSCIGNNTYLLPSKYNSINISENNIPTLNYKNKSKNLLYEDSIKLKIKINKLKQELDLAKSENRKKEEEIKKREKAIETAKNKLKENNSFGNLKEENIIIKLKDNYQILKSKINKQVEENNKLQNEIKQLNINELENENNNNLILLKEKINEYNDNLQFNLMFNDELNLCTFNKKEFFNNHSYIEKMQKKINEKTKKINLMKENLQIMKDRINQIEENRKRIISYNDSIKKQNEKLLIDKKKREDFILKKPLILGKINEYELKTKNFEDKNKNNENQINSYNLERQKLTKQIKESEISKPIDYTNLICIEKNPKENINQKILLLESLIKESKDRQNEFIEIFAYYDDYVRQKNNYELINNEAKLIEEKNNYNNNNQNSYGNNNDNDNVNFDSSPHEEFNNNKKETKDVFIDNNDNDNSPPFIPSSIDSKNKFKENNKNFEDNKKSKDNVEIKNDIKIKKENKEQKNEKENQNIKENNDTKDKDKYKVIDIYGNQEISDNNNQTVNKNENQELIDKNETQEMNHLKEKEDIINKINSNEESNKNNEINKYKESLENQNINKINDVKDNNENQKKEKDEKNNNTNEINEDKDKNTNKYNEINENKNNEINENNNNGINENENNNNEINENIDYDEYKDNKEFNNNKNTNEHKEYNTINNKVNEDSKENNKELNENKSINENKENEEIKKEDFIIIENEDSKINKKDDINSINTNKQIEKDKIDSKKKIEKKFKSFKIILSIMLMIKKIPTDKIEDILSTYQTKLKDNNNIKNNDEDKNNFLLNIGKDILNLINNNNENDLKFLKKYLIYFLEEKYQNNIEIFVKNIINDLISKNKLTFGDNEDEENQMLGKIIQAYSAKSNMIIQKIGKEKKKFISYKNLKRCLKEEELYVKNNKEKSELFKFFIYVLKKNSSLTDSDISLFDFIVEDIINFFNGILDIINDKRNDDNVINEEDEGGLTITDEDFKKIINKFTNDFNLFLREKKLTLNTLLGEENINIMVKDGKEIEVIDIYKFIYILNEKGFQLNDNFIISCIFAKYQINENLEVIDINLLNNDLQLIENGF